MTNCSAPLPEASALFDAGFTGRHLSIAAQCDDQSRFITELASACAPMAGLLPLFMLEQQSAMQEAAYRRAFPAAMRRIVLHRCRPVGRIIVDWTPSDHSLGVDIAVLPDARTTGAALAMLRAWLRASDALARPARLSVRRDNPAMRIYWRLGFRPDADDRDDTPLSVMMRQPQ